MLFSNSDIIILLKRNSLEVFNQKAEGVQSRLNFPPDFEKDQEIIDIEKFEQLISNFLTKLNLKDKKIIIAISAENLFEKTLPLSTMAKEEEGAKKFFGEVPFDEIKIAKKRLRTKNGLNLIATNKNLYEVIIHILQKEDAEIEAVVPLSMFGITSQTLSKNDIRKITSNSQILKEANFLTENPEIKTTSRQKSEKNGVQEVKTFDEKTKPGVSPVVKIGIILILIGITTAAVLLFKKGFISSPDRNQPTPSPTSTSSSEQSLPKLDEKDLEATEEAEYSNKVDITIKILNGSGIAGQAQVVKNSLTSLNYSQIEVGNAKNQDAQSTKVTYSKEVPESYILEIKTELKKLLEGVETKAAEEEQEFDIIITTGQPL